jgi:prepilin-type N-terminal cleavage/methylation domain-containing protein
MKRQGRTVARGFTLIELMIVVAIIGILASIAAPMAQHAALRARAAERPVVARALVKAVEDIYALRGAINMAGIANPPGAPGTTKRSLDWTLGDWSVLADRMTIEGAVYYTYQVVSLESANPPALRIIAEGDLDGDGFSSIKTWNYARVDGAYVWVSETPPPGQEDVATF